MNDKVEDLLRQKIDKTNNEITFLKNKVAAFQTNYIHKSNAAVEVLKVLRSLRIALITALGGLLICLALFRFNFTVGGLGAIILTGILIYHLFKADKQIKYLSSKYPQK